MLFGNEEQWGGCRRKNKGETNRRGFTWRFSVGSKQDEVREKVFITDFFNDFGLVCAVACAPTTMEREVELLKFVGERGKYLVVLTPSMAWMVAVVLVMAAAVAAVVPVLPVNQTIGRRTSCRLLKLTEPVQAGMMSDFQRLDRWASASNLLTRALRGVLYQVFLPNHMSLWVPSSVNLYTLVWILSPNRPCLSRCKRRKSSFEDDRHTFGQGAYLFLYLSKSYLAYSTEEPFCIDRSGSIPGQSNQKSLTSQCDSFSKGIEGYFYGDL